jgi:hypothetical protein
VTTGSDLYEEKGSGSGVARELSICLTFFKTIYILNKLESTPPHLQSVHEILALNKGEEHQGVWGSAGSRI